MRTTLIAAASLLAVNLFTVACTSSATTSGDQPDGSVILTTGSATAVTGSLGGNTPPSPTPTSTTPRPGGALGTEANDHQVVLRIGERRSIRLSGDNLGNWVPLTATDARVVTIDQAGGYPGSAPLTAVFIALHRGTTQITSYTDIGCLHTKPACLPPQRAWRITVQVR